MVIPQTKTRLGFPPLLASLCTSGLPSTLPGAVSLKFFKFILKMYLFLLGSRIPRGRGGGFLWSSVVTNRPTICCMLMGPRKTVVGQNPRGQNPRGQNPRGQNPRGQNSGGQNPSSKLRGEDKIPAVFKGRKRRKKFQKLYKLNKLLLYNTKER